MQTINPNIKPYLVGILLFIALALLLTLCGCNELRHYNKVAADYPRSPEKRTILAPVCKLEFPAEARKDSSSETNTVVIKDTSGNAALRQQIAQLAAKLAERPDCPQFNVDSVFGAWKSQMKPDTIKTTIKVKVVETKIDSAGMKILQDQYGQLTRDYNQKVNALAIANIEIDSLNGKLKDANRWKWYFFILCGLIAAYIGLRITKKVP